MYYLKLRNNVALDGDIELARRELAHFFGKVEDVKKGQASPDLCMLLPESLLYAHARKDGIVGFCCGEPQARVAEIVKRVDFIQEVWFADELCEDDLKGECYVADVSSMGKGIWCAIPLMCVAELLSNLRRANVSETDIVAITNHLSGKRQVKDVAQAIYKRRTSTPHAHALHKYKAKFFPRMVRSFINTCTNEAKIGNGFTVLDPFVGSGTTLVECKLMGINSIGVDIDRLSCLISQAKLDLIEAQTSHISKAFTNGYSSNGTTGVIYHFPSWIRRKFERWNNLEEMRQLESDVNELLNMSRNTNGAQTLYKIALSDALSKKFNIRMMGTGSGRFALEIAKSNLLELYEKNLNSVKKQKSVIGALQIAYKLNGASAQVHEGNATKMKEIKDESIDLIVTSPPYLPASSGRENYLIGKSISITALDLLSEQDIRNAEKASVGSMVRRSKEDRNGLPDKVYELYDWLKKDELRAIKANPTLSYYLDLRKALAESYRVLKGGGKAVYIIGKESVFYTFKTREVLYRVHCDKIFIELAESVGFKMDEQVDIELDKQNKNARPRSMDKYYESAIILKK